MIRFFLSVLSVSSVVHCGSVRRSYSSEAFLMRWLTLGAAAVLLAALSGCAQPRSRVFGTVRFQGKPLAYGTIVFLPPDNQAYPVRLDANGSYQTPPIPRGHI